MSRLLHRPALLAWCFTALVIAATTAVWPRYERPFTEAPIAWDVSGYYLYLPAVFIYGDLRELKFLPDIMERYRPSSAPDQAFPYGTTAEGHPRYVMKYSAGMALMYLPFFLAAHAIASVGPWPADGFSMPYQVAIQWGGVLVALLGLYLLLRLLQVYFSEKIAGTTVLIVGLGTNFFNYATYDAANPHVWLFTLLAAVVLLTRRWYLQPSWHISIALGLCIGLAALARPTEIIYALVPLTWGLANIRQTIELWKRQWKMVVLAGATCAAVGFIQLLYWKYAAGEWVVYSYGEQGFSFLHPHFSDVFFSWRKGWFVYTPVMLLAIAGLPLLWRRHRQLRWPVLVFFVVNTWIIASWDIWWYGGAFGQRAFIQSYVLLSLPMATLLEWVAARRLLRLAVAAFVVACVFLNQFQTWQAHHGPFETEAMTEAYYKRIFLKTHIDPYDRLLLDNTDVPPADIQPLDTLLFEDFENFSDTAFVAVGTAHSGEASLRLPAREGFTAAVYLPKTAALTAGTWLRVEAWFYGPKKEWETWWMPQFVVFLEKDGQMVLSRMVRPFRVVSEGQWALVPLWLRLPEEDFDQLRIFMLNPRGSVEMYMDDLRVIRYRQGTKADVHR